MLYTSAKMQKEKEKTSFYLLYSESININFFLNYTSLKLSNKDAPKYALCLIPNSINCHIYEKKFVLLFISDKDMWMVNTGVWRYVQAVSHTDIRKYASMKKPLLNMGTDAFSIDNTKVLSRLYTMSTIWN